MQDDLKSSITKQLQLKKEYMTWLYYFNIFNKPNNYNKEKYTAWLYDFNIYNYYIVFNRLEYAGSQEFKVSQIITRFYLYIK